MSQEILAFLYGQTIFRHCGADESAEGTEGEESTEDEDGDDEEAEQEKGKPPVPKDPKIAALKKEAGERRIALREANKKITELEAKAEELSLKDASELEKAKAAVTKLEAGDAKKEAALKKAVLENAALKTKIVIDKKTVEWVDIEDVLNHLHGASGVEVDEDGTVSGVEDVLKKLAKAKPHWIKAAAPVNGGAPSGVNSGGGSGKPDAVGAAKEAAFLRKYPGLRR